jgi:hypothetical protein
MPRCWARLRSAWPKAQRRQVFFKEGGLPVGHVFGELGIPLGAELLRPTLIYVPEIMEVIERVPTVKALINITGDLLLSLADPAARKHRHRGNVSSLQYGDRLLRSRRGTRRRPDPGYPGAPRPARVDHRPCRCGEGTPGSPAASAAHRSRQNDSTGSEPRRDGGCSHRATCALDLALQIIW